MSIIQQFVPQIVWKLADILSCQFWEGIDEDEVNILDDCLLKGCTLGAKCDCRLIMPYCYHDFLQEEFFLPVCEELVKEW